MANVQLRGARQRISQLLLTIGVLLAVLVPGTSTVAASASNVFWVALPGNGIANSSGQGTSCSHPGFNNPQAAVNASSARPLAIIKVCPGTYGVQIQITTPNRLLLEAANPKAKPTLQLPAKPRNSTTNCDRVSNKYGGDPPDQEELVVCGTPSTNVTISGMVIRAAWPHGSCYTNMQGILIAGGSTLFLANSAVTATKPIPDSVCALGNEVVDGMSWTPTLSVGHLKMQADVLSGYDQLGVRASGKGTTLSAVNVTVIGEGPKAPQLQTGIQVQYGALGQISHSRISDNLCGPGGFRGCAPGVPALSTGTGVVFAEASHGSFLDYSTISGNGVGATYSCSGGVATCDGSWLKSHPDVSFIGDKFIGETSVDLAIYDGRAVGRGNVLSNAQTGYLFFQEASLIFPADYASSGDRVSGMSTAAVEIWDSPPNYRGHAGVATLTNCKLSGNPGATVKGSILNYSPDYVITLKGDS
jgi:hypothetical protein